MAGNNLVGTLNRDLYVLQDETNPATSELEKVYPTTVLDQVFDDQSPSKKTLRQIIEELKQEIITGGRGNIVFPVTTVNGKNGDVIITKADLGLGRVDNTRDADKPLSVPQREAIMTILSEYDFNVNFSELYDHLMDTQNPHGVTLDQINKDDVLVDFVKKYIGYHNTSTEHTTHIDIRRSLSTLWNLVDDINNNLENRVGNVLNAMEKHQNDVLAHQNLFDKKEDIVNKVLSFSTTIDNDHTKYPSTRAVVEFVASRLKEFKNELPNVENWIDDIIIINTRDELPSPTERFWRKAYFINKGNSSHNEVAICKQNPDGKSYAWDISPFGTYTKFDERYFKDSTEGLTLIMSAVVADILDKNGALDTYLADILSKYYTKEDIDEYAFLRDVKIVPGTQDGTIRYYFNDDLTTMSNDVSVSGLKRLAYLEWITENEIWDQAIHSNHIISNAIENRHIQDKSIKAENLYCGYGNIFANTRDQGGNSVNELTLVELADYLRPLIGGWPDPNTPGENPWSTILDGRVPSIHLMQTNVEYQMNNYCYFMRFTGEISVIENMDFKELLTDKINLKEHMLVDAGGTWEYQSNPSEWTILGGSNITGHTFATVNMTDTGVYMESISIGMRMKAKYDIWIKYTKPAELDKIQNPQ